MMDSLPVEILHLIFEEFSSLKDIQNCYNTCKKWRIIISKIFNSKGGKSRIFYKTK